MKILLIEDEQPVADYVGMFLRDAGYSVERASDAAQAQAKVASNSYDLILLDLMLPDATGPELLPKLKSVVPKTPVLVVTGVAYDDDRLVECLKNGAAGWVPKSSRADQLLTAVRRVLRE
jgi:DNA-binding response OmpR family regulator